MSFSQPRVGVRLVLERDRRVLLGLRRGSPGAEEWALPGGWKRASRWAARCARSRRRRGWSWTRHGVGAAAVNQDLFPVEGQHWVML